MYSLATYGRMVTDRIRVEAYAEALRVTVRPGSVVVDIGTGTGVMAILACQLGASRVYAIEPEAIIQVGREIAAVNRCAEKIEFIENLSTKVTLPVRADVIVSDMRGVLPLFGHHIEAIADARHRFLAPGGTLIPRRDTVWAAVVEAPELYGGIVGPWERNVLGQNLSPGRRMVVNDVLKARVTPDRMLTKPQLWAVLDYTTVENPDFRSELEWRVDRFGTGHGIVVWFETELVDGVSFSNAPGAPEAIYSSLFFPWLNPTPLAEGQTVRVDLQAKLLEEDYAWRWTTRIESLEHRDNVIVHFDQSQLQAMMLSVAKLRRSSSDYVPRLSEEGHMHQRVIELMDGKNSLEEIARRLATEFPQRFSCWQQALSFAGVVSQEYSG